MACILLVENHDEVRGFLREAIEASGHTADCAATKAEAEKALSPGSHDLVICNVVLPDGSGREIAAKAADLGIKIVLITGHPDEMQAMKIAGIAHLGKPFGVPELARMIQDALGN